MVSEGFEFIGAEFAQLKQLELKAGTMEHGG